MEFTLLGAAALAVASLYAVLWWEAGRTNAAGCTRQLWDTALGAAVAGLAAGRLGAMILGGTNPITHPADILIVRSGVDTGVAAVVALGTLGVMARKDLWHVADGLAPAALAGLAGWHAGCVIRGTCLGTPSDLPWAVAADGSSITRHPVEIYAAAILVITAVALIAWKGRFPPPGVIAGIALVAAAVSRLATEPIRPSIGSGPRWWYVAGIAAGLVVAAWRWRTARSDSG